jgi:hypothetical protein
MTYRFAPNASFIAVEAVLVGPTNFCQTILALDTGATQTGIDEGLLKMLGFDASMAIRSGSTATAGGVVKMVEYRLPAFSALGIDFYDFEVCAADFSASSFDGVLGLDFYRNRVLTIDFQLGTIDLR